VNNPPTASFTLSCMRLECAFRDFSSDPDGTLVRWSWAFGDGNAALSDASADPVHVFAAGGRYRVTLEVTDDDGAVATTSEYVAVGVVRSVRGRKQKGRHIIELTWTGAETSQVDVYVDGRLEATAANSGAFTYQASARGQATYRLKVCEAGSGMCSLEQSVAM
jgi:PKD repeat protein